MRQVWVLSPAVAVAVLAGGCTGPTPVESTDRASSPVVEQTGEELLTRQQEADLLAEYDDRRVACLEDNGIGVTPFTEGGGGWELDLGGMDDGTFFALEAKCSEMAGGMPSSAPITAEEAAGLYDLNLETKACLEALGVVVSDPPSREVYVDDYLAGIAPWSPYDGGVPQHELEESCPQPGLEDLE